MRLPVITNKNEISLEMAVWLLHDEYDYIKEENYISATGLMKPIRHILLPPRIPEEQRKDSDVEDYIASAMGSALHAGIEKAWLNEKHVRKALAKLGHPESVIDRVLVNPTPEQLTAKPNAIAVYIEKRSFKKIEVDGVTFTVGGKFDMLCDGRLADTKSTSVWTWVYGGKEDDYAQQGSIYRWLNQDIVTEDHIRINFIFTDWNKMDAQTKKDKNYPDKRVKHKDIPLWSLEKTEEWIRNKLRQILVNQKVHETQLPECTPQELWMSDPKFKYFIDPTKTFGRSTKNFDTLLEATIFKTEEKGGKGVIVTVPGAPKRCGYCPAFPVCTQRNKYTFD